MRFIRDRFWLKLAYGIIVMWFVGFCAKQLPAWMPGTAQVLYAVSAVPVNLVRQWGRSPSNVPVVVVDISPLVITKTGLYDRYDLAHLVKQISASGALGIAVDNDFSTKPSKQVPPGEQEFFREVLEAASRIPVAVGVGHRALDMPADQRFTISDPSDPDLTRQLDQVQAVMSVRGQVATEHGPDPKAIRSFAKQLDSQTIHAVEGLEVPPGTLPADLPKNVKSHSVVVGPNWAPMLLMTTDWDLPTITGRLARFGRDDRPKDNPSFTRTERLIAVEDTISWEKIVDYGALEVIRKNVITAKGGQLSTASLGAMKGKYVVLAAVMDPEEKDRIFLPFNQPIMGGLGQACIIDSVLRDPKRRVSELTNNTSHAYDFGSAMAILFIAEWISRRRKAHALKEHLSIELTWTLIVILVTLVASLAFALLNVLWFNGAAFILGHLLVYTLMAGFTWFAHHLKHRGSHA